MTMQTSFYCCTGGKMTTSKKSLAVFATINKQAKKYQKMVQVTIFVFQHCVAEFI